MKKIYISFLIVFVVLAAIFTIFKNMTSGVINTALIAGGEGSNIQVDQGAAAAEKKKKKKNRRQKWSVQAAWQPLPNCGFPKRKRLRLP